MVYRKKKKKINQEKNNESYQNSKNNNNTHYLRRLKILQEDLHNAIIVSKQKYHSQIAYKLTHIQKTYKSLSDMIKAVFH